MRKVKETAEILALVALILVLGKATLFLDAIQPKVLVTIENTDRAMIAAGAAAGNMEKASRTWQTASTSQAAQVTAATRSVNAAVASFTTFLSRTDASLNGSLAPLLSRSVELQSSALLKANDGLLLNLSASQKLLADADAELTDPNIKLTLANLEAMTIEGAETAQDIHQEADTMVDLTKKALEPEAKWKSIGKMLFGGGMSLLELVYYAHGL